VGIDPRMGAVRVSSPAVLQELVMQLLERYFLRTLLKRQDKLTISNFLSRRNSWAPTQKFMNLELWVMVTLAGMLIDQG
jgi:hypothetical protein